MPRFPVAPALALLFAATVAPHSFAAESRKLVTLGSLLAEMTDRAAVARLPQPRFTLKQASSHDRRKNDPGDAETWHSNTDYGQFLHTEVNEGRREWVIMEETGPGAIVRFWTPLLADKDTQVIRFYFDGSPTPAITARLNDLLSGRDFVKPPFAFIAWNQSDLRDERKPDYKPRRGVAGDLYLPIPFAKGCKVTLDSVPFYYVINYRSYDPGTPVRTFSMAGYSANAAVIEKTGDMLLDNASRKSAASGALESLAPGAERTLDLKRGPAAVTEVALRIDPAEADRAQRNIIVQATFDGEETVWCPLAEFFGAGVRPSPVRDGWRSVGTDGTLSARWVMPYQHAARITLRNTGDRPIRVSLSAATGPWRWNDRSLHFHARWHSVHGLKTRPRSDWNYLEAKGEGRYVGDTLTVWSPVKEWYGEGDERIYVDGATFPAHIGTGTEDYYGYAWGMSGWFSSPFISMPKRDREDQGDWRGYTTTSRLRLLDSIPFSTGMRHDMEIWNWADTQVDNAVATFYYARPGATDNREPQPREAAVAIKAAPEDYHIEGAVEIESLPVAAKSPGVLTEIQDAGLKSGEWSGGKQLFVRAARDGDYVEIAIPVPDDRPRHAVIYGTKSFDYGVLRFTINGERAGADYDAWSADSVPTGPIDLGRVTPKDGKLILHVEVVGSNPAARGARHYFGLDCVKLKREP